MWNLDFMSFNKTSYFFLEFGYWIEVFGEHLFCFISYCSELNCLNCLSCRIYNRIAVYRKHKTSYQFIACCSLLFKEFSSHMLIPCHVCLSLHELHTFGWWLFLVCIQNHTYEDTNIAILWMMFRFSLLD